jgi:hypothetical protein
VSPAGQVQKHWKNGAQSAVTHAPLQLSTVHRQHPVLISAEVHDGPVNGNAPELDPLELPVPPSLMTCAVRPPQAKKARSAATAAGATSEPLLMQVRSLPPKWAGEPHGQAIVACCAAVVQSVHELQLKVWAPTVYQAAVQVVPLNDSQNVSI